MEPFFPDESPLRLWLDRASVSHISCSPTWPPTIAATGYAPCLRAWTPTSRDEPQFKPMEQLMEVDGERFVACTIKGDLLVAADASGSGRIGIWDTRTGVRQQTLLADAPVTSLDASRTYIAAGTSAGYVRVWKRHSSAETTFAQFFQPDLQLDTLPVYGVWIRPLRPPAAAGSGAGGAGGAAGGDGGGGDSLLVVHTLGNGRVTAWRLSDAKIVGSLGRAPPPPGAAPDAAALLSANVVAAHYAKDTLLTVSWLPGQAPLLQWVHPLARKGAEIPGLAEHLAGVGRPLAVDYDGDMVAMGCQDGLVWVWGLVQPGEVGHWRGYHAGAVGAVACLPQRHAIASGGADGAVRLWSRAGQLLAVCRLGWQVTALAVNELALVAGGAEGQVQLLVLVPPEEGSSNGNGATGSAAHGSRASEADKQEAGTRPQGSKVAAYAHWFDARVRAPGGALGAGATGAAGRAADHPDAFHAFAPPRRQVTAEDLMQQGQQAGGSGGGGGGEQGAKGDGGAEEGGEEGSGGGEAGGSSSFNMRAALKGAHRTAADQAAAQAAEEEAKLKQLRAMGEGPGVARSRGAVQLDGATAALGRKCSNASCLQREGLVALAGSGQGGFKRCGACKSVVYCSAHCQSTHWRDGHKQECAVLAEAWKQQMLREQQAAQAALAELGAAREGAAAAPQQHQQQQEPAEAAGCSGALAASNGGSSACGSGAAAGGAAEAVEAHSSAPGPAPAAGAAGPAAGGAAGGGAAGEAGCVRAPVDDRLLELD